MYGGEAMMDDLLRGWADQRIEDNHEMANQNVGLVWYV
jgi:hypothetical protein